MGSKTRDREGSLISLCFSHFWCTWMEMKSNEILRSETEESIDWFIEGRAFSRSYDLAPLPHTPTPPPPPPQWKFYSILRPITVLCSKRSTFVIYTRMYVLSSYACNNWTKMDCTVLYFTLEPTIRAVDCLYIFSLLYKSHCPFKRIMQSLKRSLTSCALHNNYHEKT